MRIGMIVGVALLGAATPAAAMPVSAFLAKADTLQKKGAMAVFSSDLKLLMNVVKQDFAQLRAERLAAKAAQRPAAFCPPEGGVKMTNKDIMDAMQAVPASSRPSTDTRDALRSYMARRFPC